MERDLEHRIKEHEHDLEIIDKMKDMSTEFETIHSFSFRYNLELIAELLRLKIAQLRRTEQGK